MTQTSQQSKDDRYVAWFHELDAWTEYWDIYHPETKGRFYFGDGASEEGLLTQFLPRFDRPAVFTAWHRMALGLASGDEFRCEAWRVAAAVTEVDDLVGRLFEEHFGDASDSEVQSDYLEAIFRFAIDSLPPDAERAARVLPHDPRRATAGRHTLEGDLMWFAWALELESAQLVSGDDGGAPRRALLLAGVASGCPANFAWRSNRYTRSEYRADEPTRLLLRERAMRWAVQFEEARREVHALYRLREGVTCTPLSSFAKEGEPNGAGSAIAPSASD